MKNDLIITRFKTEPVIGTLSTFDPKTFFGSKMIDVEDEIIVDESQIQYTEIFDSGNTNNNGYQYYIDVDDLETEFLKDLSVLKKNNHNIVLLPQSNLDLTNNTNWNLVINWKNILLEYLFYKLKEVRTFKCIRYNDVLSENINYFIREYITNNLLNRYEFKRLDMYVKYYDLENIDPNKKPNLIFNPLFTVNVKNNANLIKNINTIIFDTTVSVNYKQTQLSTNKKFNYYFDIVLSKI